MVWNARWFSAGGGVFQPEQAIRLQVARQPRRLDRGQAVVRVVQQFDLLAMVGAQLFEQLGHHAEITRRGPHRLGRPLALGRLVRRAAAGDAVGLVDPGHATLCAAGDEAEFAKTGDFLAGLRDVAAVGVAVDQRALARAPAQQRVQRHAGHLAEDVPQRHVHRGDRGHRHRPAPPGRAAVEELPEVVDAAGVAADQVRHHVVLQVGRHRQFATVEGGVAQAVHAGAGDELEGDEIAPRAGDHDPRLDDLAVAGRALGGRSAIGRWGHRGSLTGKRLPRPRPGR
jgi:hypothetical protein